MVKKLRNSGGVVISVLAAFLLLGCQPKDYSEMPTYSRRNFLQAVIENPAGTNAKVQYCRRSHRFRLEMADGEESKLEYLPYPANFGFIPSTSLDNVPDEHGRMLDVIVVSKPLEVGDIIEIIPLGMLILKDDFTTAYEIIAVPVNKELQTVHAMTLQELTTSYPDLTAIIEQWFLNASIYEKAVILGWEDEHVAQQFINKWQIR